MKDSKKKIKVKDKSDLVRDVFSKAIINTDQNNYAQAKARKKRLLEQNDRLIKLDETVTTLQSDYLELKNMFEELVNKYNK